MYASQEHVDATVWHLKDPGGWPQWPFLPMKRYTTNNMETAYVVAQEGKLTTLHHGNMFAAKPDEDPTTAYDSVEAILADGWLVD